MTVTSIIDANRDTQQRSHGLGTAYDPWPPIRRLMKSHGWKVVYEFLPGSICGLTDWPKKTISIDPRCPQWSWRCTLTHELIHVERGPAPYRIWGDEIDEKIVQRLTAERLVALDELAYAAAPGCSVADVAMSLSVPEEVLETRLQHLGCSLSEVGKLAASMVKGRVPAPLGHVVDDRTAGETLEIALGLESVEDLAVALGVDAQVAKRALRIISELHDSH